MKFTEETLEKAVIELFGEVQIPHIQGQNIHRIPEDVLLQDDFRNYLEVRYSNEEITSSEIDSIIRTLESLPSSALYESNRKFLSLVANGFNLIWVMKMLKFRKMSLYQGWFGNATIFIWSI